MRYETDFTQLRPTTKAVRRAIQNSQESLRTLAKRYGINQKTVAKWKQRETVADLPTGPKEATSTVLSIEEDHRCVPAAYADAARRLPLCAAADLPASERSSCSLPPAPRYQPIAGSRR